VGHDADLVYPVRLRIHEAPHLHQHGLTSWNEDRVVRNVEGRLVRVGVEGPGGPVLHAVDIQVHPVEVIGMAVLTHAGDGQLFQNDVLAAHSCEAEDRVQDVRSPRGDERGLGRRLMELDEEPLGQGVVVLVDVLVRVVGVAPVVVEVVVVAHAARIAAGCEQNDKTYTDDSLHGEDASFCASQEIRALFLLFKAYCLKSNTSKYNF